MAIMFYGFIGIILLFFIIVYAVQIGIDTSKQLKALRSELKQIKMELKKNEGK